MERIVKVMVNAEGGVSPKTPQYAGVQGEHNACRIAFDVTAWADEPFSYRGEFIGGDGAGGTTAVLAAEEGCVSFWLPAAWTAAGGRAVARLVASVTVDGEEVQTVYAVDVPLYFAAKQEHDTAVREEAYTGFTALAEAVQAAVDTVEEKLVDGSLVGPQGPEGKQGVSGVYVGGGEMPEGYNVQIDPDGEPSMRLSIGKVETLSEFSVATASVTGTEEEPVLNLGLPCGRTGERGATGKTPVLSIGTVETLEEGQEATASICGTEEAPILNLGIPRGSTGQQGPSGTEKVWQVIAEHTLTEPQSQLEITPNGRYTEVYIECVYRMETEETTTNSVLFGVGRGSNYITRNAVSVKNGDVVYYRAWGKISPSKRAIFDAVASVSRFANMASNCADATKTNVECFDSGYKIRLHVNSSAHKFGVGSTIKVWGC